jgi:hypothetical protein
MTEAQFVYLDQRVKELKARRQRIYDSYDEHRWPEEATEAERPGDHCDERRDGLGAAGPN